MRNLCDWCPVAPLLSYSFLTRTWNTPCCDKPFDSQALEIQEGSRKDLLKYAFNMEGRRALSGAYRLQLEPPDDRATALLFESVKTSSKMQPQRRRASQFGNLSPEHQTAISFLYAFCVWPTRTPLPVCKAAQTLLQ